MTRQVELRVDGETLVFVLREGETEEARVAVPFTWDTLTERFVRHPIPTEAEVEHAINVIEDELMKPRELRNESGLALVTREPVLNAVLNEAGEASRTWTRDEVEALFTRYAQASMGRAGSQSAMDVDARGYMALLVVREIVHHLGYEGITVVGEG